MEKKAQAVEILLARATGQVALNHAIHAAELYMRAAAEEATSKAEAARLRRKCKGLIAHAERLKAQVTQVPSSMLRDNEAAISPLSCTSPSPAELEILCRATRLHGIDYPPWQGEPSENEFQLQSGTKPFIDDTVFTLSPTQASNFLAWSRPYEIFGSAVTSQDEDRFMRLGKNCNLVQDITTDCSVVASLSAAVKILTGRHSVLSRILYPFDHRKNQPKLSKSGKYIIRMNFNGCSRRVVIDDRLPASNSDRALFVLDSHNPYLVWPALLEKAYLKVRGGYDFPGSNSGTDLWVLTGWIPEQLFLQREDFDIDETWSRIEAAYDSDDVVVTLGTGRISSEEEAVMGLIGEHDYAVQDINSTGGIRRLLVKNPWSNDAACTGSGKHNAIKAADTRAESMRPNHHQSEGFLPSSGTLWLTIEDVAQHFESMYLNWNPNSFPHRYDHHFAWDIPSIYISASLVRNPQFSVATTKGDPIWVLVSRHFVDAELDIARKRTGSMAAVARQLGFMSILVFNSNGNKVQTTDGATYRGPYVDSPQTLARLDTEPGMKHTIVLDQHQFPLSNYTFTMSIFSHEKLNVKVAGEAMAHITEHHGAWTRRTAGGNASCSTYFLNPQYKLTLSQASALSILLSTDNRDIHVHIDVVWGGGYRAMTVRAKDLVASSGEYRQMCAVADIPELDAGSYTLVCSTFEVGQVAAYSLRVSSMKPVTLDSVPTDAAGRLRTSLPSLRIGVMGEQWRAALSVSWLTRATVSLDGIMPVPRSVATGSCSSSSMMLRVTVVHGWGPEQVIVAESGGGKFQDCTATIRTSEFDMEPRGERYEAMWLVIESIGSPQIAHLIQGEIFSDSPVLVSAWEAQ